MIRLLAWSMLGLAIALGSAGVVLGLIAEQRELDLPPTRESMLVLEAIALAAASLYGVVGLIISLKQPRNAITWIFLASALALGVMTFATGYADLALYGGEDWSGGVWFGWSANWLFIPPVFIAPCFVAQLFPDGRPLSRRWAWVLWLSVAFATEAVLTSALEPGAIQLYPDRDNPAAPDGVAGDLVGTLNSIGELVLAPAFLLASLAVLVVRFRRSSGVEREQMKWLAFAGSVVVVAFAISSAWDPLVGDGLASDIIFLTGVGALVFMPIAVAIAILRYRLYEIDRVISKTLVYASLTVILGAAYVGLVLAGQAIFSSFAGGSNLAIAVSTLLVAGLFLPLRSRIQRFVDRRFYRRRYDAQRTLEAFGARLREEVDLETLTDDLRGVVTETMQPAHVSLWLRQEARS